MKNTNGYTQRMTPKIKPSCFHAEGYLMESLKGNSEMLWLGKLAMLLGKELMMVAAW